MSKRDLKPPEYYLNRELSWLEFNGRVLGEGLAEDVPLLERLKFLAITSSNLDEFFMVRVAGLMQQRAAGVRRRDISGLTPVQQLAKISERVHRMVADQAEGIRRVLGRLRQEHLWVLAPQEWTPPQRRFIEGHFTAEIGPVLSPLAVRELVPAPLLPDRALNVALVLGPGPGGRGGEDLVVIPVPRCFPRFLAIPASGEGLCLAPLEEVIAAHAGALFPGREVLAHGVFRVTRDADVPIQDEDAADLLHAVEEAVLSRRRRAAVRLEISAGPDPRICRWAAEWLALRPEDVYEVPGLLDPGALVEIVNRPGLESLRNPDWPPQTPRDLLGEADLWRAVQAADVLLFHPYESFEPVVRMVQQAAEDPNVLAIKQTLYRTSGDSPIIGALERAAENGKQVTVLVELRARFEEARNVGWARRLEDAGCTVIYGIAGYKTHSKAVLVLRREAAGLRRYVHLGTGNYNDRTARLYSDIGLLTADDACATDVAAFFNLLTGSSETVGWSKLAIAPTDLRRRFTDLIEREARASTPDRPGLILAKVNSLQDPGIIKALYRASGDGVRILLNVRGICCLRPGVKGVSETIEVRSIVDRFLEHARVFYFRNGGHDEVYLSSADWMSRNLDRRLEILFPVQDAAQRRRLVGILETFFQDNVKARRLRPDGTYEPVPREGPAVRAQERFYREAVEAARAARESGVRFRPLTRPEPPAGSGASGGVTA